MTTDNKLAWAHSLTWTGLAMVLVSLVGSAVENWPFAITTMGTGGFFIFLAWWLMRDL